MKIAIVHDGLFTRGGAERVCLNFHRAFPDAPLFVAIYDAERTYPEFKECDIRTSWFHKIAHNEKQFKYLFYPLGIKAMEMLDVTGYDVVLISTTTCAKYVKVSPDALVFTYCFTPFRLAWNPMSYNAYEKSRGLKRILFDLIISRLKKIDFKHAQRTDYFLAMTKETSKRLKDAYQFKKEIPVINPSINCSSYFISEKTDDYYLLVSRLEKYKKVDLVIEVFNQLKLPLIIVGRGMEKESLIKTAQSNIEFMEGVSDKDLGLLYSKCKAFIFPPYEDYGLTPLEAIASGRPVLAYGRGGILETMIPYKGDNEAECTAVFFDEQKPESLIDGLNILNRLNFNTEFIRTHAEKFDNSVFIENIKRFINETYSEYSRER